VKADANWRCDPKKGKIHPKRRVSGLTRGQTSRRRVVQRGWRKKKGERGINWVREKNRKRAGKLQAFVETLAKKRNSVGFVEQGEERKTDRQPTAENKLYGLSSGGERKGTRSWGVTEKGGLQRLNLGNEGPGKGSMR